MDEDDDELFATLVPNSGQFGAIIAESLGNIPNFLCIEITLHDKRKKEHFMVQKSIKNLDPNS